MNKRSCIFFLLFLITAQVNSQQDTLNLDDIYVVKSYKPQINESGEKISKLPTPLVTEVKRLEVNYPFIEKEYKIAFHPSSIEAAKMRRPKLTKLYKNYMIGSIGNYLNTNFELYHSNKRSSSRSSGFYLKHLGSSANIKEAGYAGFSKNNAQGFYQKHYAAKNYYKVAGGMQYNKFHYYGYDPLFYTDFTKKNTDNAYFGPNASIVLGNQYTNKDGEKSGYEGELHYQFWQDRFANTEHNPVLRGSYLMPLENKDFLRVEGLIDHNTFTRDSLNFSNTIIGIRPVFNTRFSDLEIHAGIGLYGDFGSTNTVSLKPIINAQYHLIEGIFIPYFNIDGSVNRTNFYSLSNENNFINSNNLSLLNENRSYDIKTGLKLSISDEITANFSFRNGVVKNNAFFINDTLGFMANDLTYFSGNSFIAIYDRLTYTSLVAEVNVIKTNKYSINALASNTKYSTQKEEKAWHLPAIHVALDGRYYFSDKIIFNALMVYNAKRFAKVYDPLTSIYTTKELSGYVDVNLGAEYRYTNKLSAFIQARNLIGNRYEIWNNFPVQSINAIFGIKATF